MAENDLPLLTRQQVPEFLAQEVGIPIGFSSFEKLCVTGQGPAVAQYWGKRPLYRRSAVKNWGLARLRPAEAAVA
jgi:hypothetical protein